MRVRKLFIFYNYKKQIACVGADDGYTLVSGFILIKSLQHPPIDINGGKTFLYGLSDPRLKF